MFCVFFGATCRRLVLLRPLRSVGAGRVTRVRGRGTGKAKPISEKIKKAPPKELRRRDGAFSPVLRGSAAGEVGGGAVPGGFPASGVVKVNTVALPRQRDQMVPDPTSPVSRKTQRKRKKFRHKKKKKRDLEVVSCASSDPSPMPPREQEDWETEIQEVTLQNWDKICFGVRAYGPEDLLQLSLRDLTLERRDGADPPATAAYRPSVHHPQPVRWSRYSISTEPDQFTDASE